MKDLERDAQLTPCEVDAQTAVRPEPEAQVAVGDAAVDDLVRLGELLRVAVRGLGRRGAWGGAGVPAAGSPSAGSIRRILSVLSRSDRWG